MDNEKMEYCETWQEEAQIEDWHMLISFHIKNFKSIVEAELNLSANDGAAVPCLGLYGANASGKSNILEALVVFRDIILKRSVDNSWFPNKVQSATSHSSFELKFAIGQNIYTYSLSYNGISILEENFECDNKRLYFITNSDGFDSSFNFSTIATKGYPIEKLQNIFKVECTGIYGQQTAFLSVLGKNYAGLNKDVTTTFHYFVEHIISYDDYYTPTNVADRLQDVSKVIKKLDINIDSMQVEQGKIYTYHKAPEGKEIRFELYEESLGTQIVTNMLDAVLMALETGSIILVDELDASLHPLLLREVIGLFKDERYNTKGAQLIFTAHNTEILAEDGIIHANEFGIVTKTQKKGTTLARASDYDIDDDRSLREAYLDGAFGGIPFPYV